MYFLSLFVVASSYIMLSIKVFGYPLSQFYPFGLTAGDSSLPGNDDGSTSSILISVPFPFFGPSYRFILVSILIMYCMFVYVKDISINYIVSEISVKSFTIQNQIS